MGGQESKLLLAAGELLVGALALALKGLAHAHEGDVETALQHTQRLIEYVVVKLKLHSDLARDLGS